MTDKFKRLPTNESIASCNTDFSSSSDSPRSSPLQCFRKLKKMNSVDLVKENQSDKKFKTELCKGFSENGFCGYGTKCRFAHGKDELFQKPVQAKKYKQKECTSFFNDMYCCYGPRCHFKHSTESLKEMERSFYTLKLEQIKAHFLNRKAEETPINEVMHIVSLPQTAFKVAGFKKSSAL